MVVGELTVHVDVRISRWFMARMYAAGLLVDLAQRVAGRQVRISIDLTPSFRTTAVGKSNLEVVIG